MYPLSAIPVFIALAASLTAAVTDVWKYRIYNALTWPLLVSGLIYYGVAMGAPGFVLSLMGVCLGFGPMFLLHLCGGLGAGDVKLMAGLGAWLGPVLTIQVLFASWIAAGVYAIGVILLNVVVPQGGQVRYRLSALAPHGSDEQLSQLIEQPHRRRRLIPFGVMILAGVVATLISTGTVL